MDNFPELFSFYQQRLKVSDKKVKELQERWITGKVRWTEHGQEKDIPEWVAYCVLSNSKDDLQSATMLCMSLNHIAGRGCMKKETGGKCTYLHTCAFCGKDGHGLYTSDRDGRKSCKKLVAFEEERREFEKSHGRPHEQFEAKLMDLAKKGRVAPRPKSFASQAKEDPWKAKNAPPVPTSPFGEEFPALIPGGGGGSRTPSTSHPDLAEIAEVEVKERNDKESPVTALAELGSARLSVETQDVTEPPKNLPPDWRAIWSPDEKAYYFWHEPLNLVQWELPMDRFEVEVPKPVAKKMVQGGSVSNNSVAKENQAPKENEASFNAPPATPPSSALNPIVRAGMSYISGRQWGPQPDVEGSLRVAMGERLVVAELFEGSDWAWVHPVEDPKNAGYVPKAILEEPQRPPGRYVDGEICKVERQFRFEPEGSGYLNVQIFEEVQVQHPVEPPGAWVYVESLKAPGSKGWVPEAFLSKVTTA